MREANRQIQQYQERLTDYTIELLKVWRDKGYTGNITINFCDGMVTSLKPSLFYGISTMPVMEGIFKD